MVARWLGIVSCVSSLRLFFLTFLLLFSVSAYIHIHIQNISASVYLLQIPQPISTLASTRSSSSLLNHHAILTPPRFPPLLSRHSSNNTYLLRRPLDINSMRRPTCPERVRSINQSHRRSMRIDRLRVFVSEVE